jgi:hypothetical protein
MMTVTSEHAGRFVNLGHLPKPRPGCLRATLMGSWIRS